MIRDFLIDPDRNYYVRTSYNSRNFKTIDGVLFPKYSSTFFYDGLYNLPSQTLLCFKEKNFTAEQAKDFLKAHEETLKEDCKLLFDERFWREFSRGAVSFFIEFFGGLQVRNTSSYLFQEENSDRKVYFTFDFKETFYNNAMVAMWLNYSHTDGDDTSDEDENTSSVFGYNYRPHEFTFFKAPKETTPVYFGLELEVNTEIPWTDIRKVMLEVEPKQPEFIYAKHDGSIEGSFPNSYELVTHPMTPRRMRMEMRLLFSKLERLVKEKKGVELSSIFTTKNTNGLHIHVSRDAFKRGLVETSQKVIQSRIGKFQLLFNSPDPVSLAFTSKFSKRKATSYCQVNEDLRYRTLFYRLTKFDTHTKYFGCNLRNRDTVEVRVFLGIPSIKHILFCIDSVEALLDFSIDAPFSAMKPQKVESSFMTWLKNQNKSKYRNMRKEIS